jgi:putative ABC transport system substrate-binding protein
MRRSLLGCVVACLFFTTIAACQAVEMKRIAISMIVEVPQLLETKQGILKGLADRGFVEGQSLSIDYQTANGSMATQQQIARKFVADRPDVIVAITTATSQAMAAATKDIPLVFVTVIDPVRAKLIASYAKPGGNVTGVSDAPPIAEQLMLLREIMPKLHRLGFVYNPGLDSSMATLGWIKEQAARLNIEIEESTAPTPNEVIPATRKLIGKVDAIYVPNDTTVVASLEAIVKIGQETRTPIFTGETRGVERGALASVGLNYTQVGQLGGNMVADVLAGAKPGDIDSVIAYEKMPDFDVALNKKAATSMGVTLPDALVKRATKVIE